MTVKVDFGDSIGCIIYDIPSQEEKTFLDNYWFCTGLFQLLQLNDILKLLNAILLENSVIFVGKQSAISTAILGFNSLLYPFKWCHAIVPILPLALIAMIDAPLPLIAGLTKKVYKEINLTRQEKSFKTWVFLETGKIEWSDDSKSMP